MKFRKKPVVIEAVQFTRPFSNATQFCPSLRLIRGDYNRVEFGIVPTLEGDHRADIGDWIIQGVKGEFYPCKPDVFEMTYEALMEVR